MVFAIERGKSCAEQLAETVEAFCADYPHAELEENPVAVQAYADQLVTYLDVLAGAAFCPRLDILEGTTFNGKYGLNCEKVDQSRRSRTRNWPRVLGDPTR